MSYVITRNRTNSKGELLVPSHEDGTPFEFCLRYSGNTRSCFFDDVTEAVAALCGDPAYLTMGEQDRLVTRIRMAMRLCVIAQSEEVYAAQQDGRWEKSLTETERQVLLAPKFETPTWSRELLGADYWTAPVPLVLSATNWHDQQLPMGDASVLRFIDAITDEDLLDSAADCSLLNVFSTDE